MSKRASSQDVQNDFSTGLSELVAKQAIAEAITRAQRGIDRHDLALLKSAFHSDADVAYGFFDGAADEFCELMAAGPADSTRTTMHRPANLWIKLTGAFAISECYVFVYSPGEGTQSLIGGRYLDRHECRAGEWRLTHRTYVLDWNINQPATGSALPNFTPPYPKAGAGTADPGRQRLATWGVQDAPINTGEGTVEVSAQLAAQAEVALAKLQIHELIVAQARAVDRADTALLRSLWHAGATVDIGDFYTGDVKGYCDLMFDVAQSFRRMAHTVNNEWIQVNGNTAVAESYVIAIVTAPAEDADQDTLSGGRYLDRFECVDGTWKYVHRSFVVDWLIEQPSTDQRNEAGGMYETLTNRGKLYPDDAVYSFWESANG